MSETPSQYIVRALATSGLRVQPVRALSDASNVRCVALRYRTEDELPAMYDQTLLKLLYDGSASEVEEAITSAPRLANAQNTMGETVLMKARAGAAAAARAPAARAAARRRGRRTAARLFF